MQNGNDMVDMNNCVIFDFETLSLDRVNGVVLSFAMTTFSEEDFINSPYSYDDLVASSKMIKFNVEEQVKEFGRKIDKSTLNWWYEQGEEAKKQLKPSSDDKSISELKDFFMSNANIPKLKKVFTRGNTFDPIFLDYIVLQQNNLKQLYPHWVVRDTRSYIEGLSFGTDLKNGFMPEGLENKAVLHDPRHDIALDIMRIQTLIRAIS
jgi:hypothetical protein